MPQLDIFVYVNLSIYFIISFVFLYAFIAYSVFPALNLVQKCRVFFYKIVELQVENSLQVGNFSRSIKIDFFEANRVLLTCYVYLRFFVPRYFCCVSVNGESLPMSLVFNSGIQGRTCVQTGSKLPQKSVLWVFYNLPKKVLLNV